MTIYEYIASWDPMGLIGDGAPRDEYDAEAFEIVSRYDSQLSDSQLAEIMHQVFVDRLGIDPKGFSEQCDLRSSEVRKILDAKASGR